MGNFFKGSGGNFMVGGRIESGCFWVVVKGNLGLEGGFR